MPERLLRRVHLLLRGPTPGTFLATTSGGLPEFALEVDPGGDDSTLTLALRSAAHELGLDQPVVLDALIEDDADDDRVVPTVVVLDTPPAAWHPPPEHRWQQPPFSGLPVAPRSLARIEIWVDEFSTGEALPAGRATWCRPGWYALAEAWIAEQLAAAGRLQIGRLEPYRWCAISAVGRATTSSGRVWFKSVFPHFFHEPAVTQAIAELAPASIPHVIAADHDRGWLLLDDVGSVTSRQVPGADAEAIRLLIELQRASIGRTTELVALGCPRRPLATIATDLIAALRDPVAADWISLDDARIERLGEWLDGVAARIAALGFPDTLIHGDFHNGNVAVREGGPVIFDWSDAAISHPLIDVITWTDWMSDEARAERAWQAFVAGWSDVCPPDAVEAVRPQLFGLLAAFHTISYVGILAALEPTRRHELADGLYFLRVLDQAAPS